MKLKSILNFSSGIKFLLVGFLVVSGLAHATEAEESAKFDPVFGTDLSIRKGALIEFRKYDEATRAYIVTSVNLPGEGDSWVTPESAARSIETIDLEQILKKPSLLVGNQYTIDKPLSTLFDEERDARKKPKKKRKDSSK